MNIYCYSSRGEQEHADLYPDLEMCLKVRPLHESLLSGVTGDCALLWTGAAGAGAQ